MRLPGGERDKRFPERGAAICKGFKVVYWGVMSDSERVLKCLLRLEVH